MVMLLQPQSVEAFGERLIDTGDLDPVYICIVGAKLPAEQLARLLLAYWMFYHLGASAWLSEQEDYWGAVKVAAKNELPTPLGGRWPRGAERRHFRGAACLHSVGWLSQHVPESLLERLGVARSVPDVMAAIEPWPLFGPWIGYKMADMLERCVGVPIQFDDDVCLLYKEPRRGLMILDPDNPGERLRLLEKHFRSWLAPPAADRACSWQEVETVLCKWKSSLGGHYWVGKDIQEIRHGLEGWGRTAQAMLAAAPQEVTVWRR